MFLLNVADFTAELVAVSVVAMGVYILDLTLLVQGFQYLDLVVALYVQYSRN